MKYRQVRPSSCLVCLLLLLVAGAHVLADSRARTIIAAGGELRSLSRSDVVTTWLEYSSVAPCWDLCCRVRLPAATASPLELRAGFSYYESNRLAENGGSLAEGEMRFLVMEAPIGVECGIPLAGPLSLIGGLDIEALYRESGRVVSETGARETKDLAVAVLGHWGLGIRIVEALRVSILADLSGGVPVYGEESLPSGETAARRTWRAGIGASAVVELLLGMLYARATFAVCGQSDVSFSSYGDYTGAEAVFLYDLRAGLEAGVRL